MWDNGGLSLGLFLPNLPQHLKFVSRQRRVQVAGRHNPVSPDAEKSSADGNISFEIWLVLASGATPNLPLLSLSFTPVGEPYGFLRRRFEPIIDFPQ